MFSRDRGTPVGKKALALGARAVLIGRPMLWGLAINGTDGVAQVLNMLNSELERALALSGASSIEDCTSDLLWQRSNKA